MKLWQKNVQVDKLVESFTVGCDAEMDHHLARVDVLGSLAHTQMLCSVGLLTADELQQVHGGLRQILAQIENGEFRIEEGVEDVHSQIELQLTEMLGPVGGKIHSGRSRNDQVLVDLKLYLRDQIQEVMHLCTEFFGTLQRLSEQHRDVLIPGYTHLQIAMPSSVGLWLGAYAESLVDDAELMLAAYGLVNRNPLGSAAGYGSSFPLDRAQTTDLLGFEGLNVNSIYAQMSRAKCERALVSAMSSMAFTVGRFATDNCMFMSQNFGFVSYPDSFTTGSSIMPHKKNPDVWELIRGKCNVIQGLPGVLSLLTANLPIGYNRDMQLLKEHVFPAVWELKGVLHMANVMLAEIRVNSDVVCDSRYDYIFSVESVNRLVVGSGVPFREAYRAVGSQIERGEYTPDRAVHHTHIGSIGNLCNDMVARRYAQILAKFEFERYEAALKNLVK